MLCIEKKNSERESRGRGSLQSGLRPVGKPRCLFSFFAAKIILCPTLFSVTHTLCAISVQSEEEKTECKVQDSEQLKTSKEMWQKKLILRH